MAMVPLKYKRNFKPIKFIDGMPDLMKLMFLNFNQHIDTELKIAFSHPSEQDAIRRLANDDNLLPTFKHLDSFGLAYEEWWVIFFGVFVKAYHDVKTGDSNELEAVGFADEQHLQEVASAAFKLFELLNDCGVPHESAAEQVLENTTIRRDLLELLSACTSAKWPERYHRWFCQQDCTYYDSQLLNKQHVLNTLGIRPEHLETQEILFSEVERLQHEEMPTLAYREYYDEEVVFPPLAIAHEATPSEACWDYLIFVEKAEYLLIETCHELGRSGEPNKNGNYLQVTEGGRIFFNPAHWKAILACLFGPNSVSGDGSEKYQAKSINGAIKRAHKRFS